MYNVYLIESELNGNIIYKVGFTKKDVNERVKALKTGNPSALTILNSFNSKWGIKIESALHREWKSKRVDGEWFFLDNNDVSSFIEKCKSIHDSLEFLSKNNTYIIDKGWYK